VGLCGMPVLPAGPLLLGPWLGGRLLRPTSRCLVSVCLVLVRLLTPVLVRGPRAHSEMGRGGCLAPSLHVVDVGVARRSSGAGACV
jgi:hypothetical protein